MRFAAVALLALGLVLGASGCRGQAASAPASIQPSAEPAGTVGTSTGQSPSASPRTEAPVMPFALTSTAFADGGPIPRIYTCDGDDVSPPLAWAGAPDGTVSLALIVDDPDAGGFIHWLAYAIDPAAASLPGGVSGVAGGISEGINSFGNVGYGGPCPPRGTHRYVFRLLALDVEPTFFGPPRASALDAAAAGHILGEATLTGTYKRGG